MTDEIITDRRYYYGGGQCYHNSYDCSGWSGNDTRKITLIEANREGLLPCGKCNPADPATEYMFCQDCGHQADIDNLERERGYRGACPECGSACTQSTFDRMDMTADTGTEAADSVDGDEQ